MWNLLPTKSSVDEVVVFIEDSLQKNKSMENWLRKFSTIVSSKLVKVQICKMYYPVLKLIVMKDDQKNPSNLLLFHDYETCCT